MLALVNNGIAGDQQSDAWWLTPQRMLQTNLREIDATMDVDQYVREVQDFGAAQFGRFVIVRGSLFMVHWLLAPHQLVVS